MVVEGFAQIEEICQYISKPCVNKILKELPGHLQDVNDINKYFSSLPTIVKSELQLKLLEKYNTNQQARQFTFSQITCHDYQK
ncbi:unnamed protein product [Acanthoscelides obtectus]|uniref:Uncharacterized protein n=1 Tax=Acanthoscelides obtectus TaxID=200917 RepID=A0A9P0PB29_ACAOB|nr:unnamed protein product [Acanthoscelides obtectus]CAK1672396.1 hypothetical protein AOBTE_LOCUS28856 [Acanthoscelides obtectus]